LYEFTRAPFGQKLSGNTFTRAVQQFLHPIRDYTGSYVDDMSVFSDDWPRHVQHIDRYLQVIKNSGLTLNLKKCHFAQSEVKFVGQIIGSNKRRPAPDKVAPVKDTKAPETKKQVRQVIVLFSYCKG